MIPIDAMPVALRRVARLLRVRPFDGVPVAGVTADGILLLGPGWDSLTDKHKEGVLLHEILHLVLRHHSRMERQFKENHTKANVAADARINLVLQRDGWSLPDGCVDIDALPLGNVDRAKLTEEQIYDLLPDSFGSGDCDVVMGETDPDREEIIRRACSKAGTELGGELSSLVPPCDRAKSIPMTGTRLARALRNRTQRKTYASPRMGADDTILPDTEPAEPASVAVLIDVSGSMTDEMLHDCAHAVSAALRGRRNVVRVLCHDVQRRSDRTSRVGKIVWPRSSGGGTALRDSLIGVHADAYVVVSDLESSDGPPIIPDGKPVYVIGSHHVPEGWVKL